MKHLIARAYLGLIFLIGCLALVLFVSAGSLAFWQAWIYLSVWTVCVVFVTTYLVKHDQLLLASRVQAGPTAETQKSQQVIQSLASLFFVALYVVAGLDFRFQWSTVPPVVSLISDAFVVVGFFIVFLVFKANSYTSAVIEVSSEQEVVTTGPYSVVRHPMYAGAMLLLLFTPTALGSWVAIPFVLPMLMVIVARLREEERLLRANLGGYEAYCQKVHYRLAPFIW